MGTVRCPNCERALELKEEVTGELAQCKFCAHLLFVPRSVPGNAVGLSPPTPVRPVPVGPDAGKKPETVVIPRNMNPRAPGAAKTTGDSPHTNATKAVTDDPPAPADPNPYAFLAPPQRPGELGRLGRYRILSRLGQGGMGIVFLAEDLQLLRYVAMKVMTPEASRDVSARLRFTREARATAQVAHQHIVYINDVNEDRNVPFMVMELLKGETLDDRLVRLLRLEVPEALRITREVATGLTVAHGRGLIHRDIKPSNIWLESPNDNVKILDFGLVRYDGDHIRLTKTGLVVGTPSYMSPEQARGDRLDARADLFSLGCLLYKILAGRVPFKITDPLKHLMILNSEQPPPLTELNPDVPASVVTLVEQLLAKDPEKRPTSAAEVVGWVTGIERALAEGREFVVERDLPFRSAPSSPGAETATSVGYPSEHSATRPMPRNGTADPDEDSEASTRELPVTQSSPSMAALRLATSGENQALPPAGRATHTSLMAWAAGVAGCLALAAAVWFGPLAAAPPGLLVVTVAEGGIEAVVDGRHSVPIDTRLIGRIKLAPGPHRLVVTRRGETLFEQEFVVKSGDVVDLDAHWPQHQDPGR